MQVDAMFALILLMLSHQWRPHANARQHQATGMRPAHGKGPRERVPRA
ncbi:hypothetical protein HMPREF1868_01155 [Olsenella sp. DNF00959]|nr:hypothetical protein HMPREF1868_01155 [Olsenella sp. DNF00959]